jgi:KaiC/GvpD/RAD55 family RecA-like ATPase
MIQNNYISTGIDNLDKLLEGGIQKGFTTLILGPPGSSIEILGKQISSTKNVLYVTTEETKQEVIDTMSRFGWDYSDIDFIDISSKFSDEILKGVGRPINIYEQKDKSIIKDLIKEGSSNNPMQFNRKTDFLGLVLDNVKKSKNEKIILNSLDFFFSEYSQNSVLRILKEIKIQNIKKNTVLFILMTKGIYEDILEKKVEGISDCIIELEVLQKGSTFERFLTIKKLRNYAKKIGIARYVVESNGFVLETVERIM